MLTTPVQEWDPAQAVEDFISTHGIEAAKKIIADVNAMNLPGPTINEYYARVNGKQPKRIKIKLSNLFKKNRL